MEEDTASMNSVDLECTGDEENDLNLELPCNKTLEGLKRDSSLELRPELWKELFLERKSTEEHQVC